MDGEVSFDQAASSQLQNLISAIRLPDIEQVKLITSQIIASGQSLDQVGAFGNTPLIWAVRCREPQIVHHLVSSGADINLRNDYGNSPLMVALMHKNESMVNFLLESGAKVNLVNNSQTTPLIEAIRTHRLDVANNLLTAGADANLVDGSDNLPLHWSIYHNRLNLVKNLLRSGSAVNLKNKHGISPFYMAFKQPNIPIVNELIKHGADIKTLVNRQDQATALHEAARFEEPAMMEALSASPDFVTLLNEEDHYGNTPLFLAASYGRILTCKHLLSAGADVNQVTPRGKTPLLAAVESSDAEMVNLCLKHGACVDVVDLVTGCSALMTAVTNGNLEIIKLLLSKGPNLGLQNRRGQTVMTIVADRARAASRFAVGGGRDGLELGADNSKQILDLLAKSASK